MQWYDTLIRYLLWFFYFIGLWLVIYQLQTIQQTSMKLSRFLKKQLNHKKATNNILYKYMEQLIASTLNLKGPFVVNSFLFSLFLIGLMTFVGLMHSDKGIFQSLLWSIVTPFFPIGFMLYLRRKMIINTSHEGAFFVTELLNNYRIFHFNIVEAMDHTVLNLKKYPNSKKMLSRVAVGLKEYQSEEELHDLIKELHYTLDTTWGTLLGNLIYNAALYGDNIQEGLSDIINQLRDLEHLKEKNKQTNMEGILLLQFFIPILIFGSFYAMFKFFGFTLKKYLEYQFINSVGFTVFFYSTVLIIGTFLLFLFMKKEKNDY